MVRISFNYLLPDIFAFLVFAAAIFVIYWIYWKKKIRLWALFFLLNSLSAVMILSMIFHPELSIRTPSRTRENLCILTDTSLSMGIKDGEGGLTRLEKVKQFVSEDPALKNYNLFLYRFGDTPEQIRDEGQITTLTPQQNTSFIFDAVMQIDKKMGKECKGILLFSDGQESKILKTDALKTDLNVPVFAIGVGKSPPADISITDAISNSPVYAGEDMKIGVSLKEAGFDNREAKLLLRENNRILQEKTITFSGSTETIEFEIPSPPKGERVYEIEAAGGEDEQIARNNRINVFTRVISPKINILYVEGSLRWECKFLKRHIENNPNFSSVFLIRVGEHLFHQTGGEGMNIPGDIFSEMKFLEKFDIIILGDINFSSFTPEQLKNLYDFVYNKGKSLIFLGGENFAAGLRHTPLEEVIPLSVTGGEKDIVNKPFIPELTEEGKTLPVFGGDTPAFPPLDRVNNVTHITPGTIPLIRAGNIRPPAVLVGINTVLPGKSAFIGTDSTWKWALGNASEKKSYQLFWGMILRYMWTPEDYSGIGKTVPEILPDRKFYGTGDMVYPEFVYRKEGKNENFKVSLTGPDRKDIPLEVESSKTSFVTEKEGLYTVGATVEEKKNTMEIFVTEGGGEFRETGRNEIFLRQIAGLNPGGKYIPFEDIGQLEDILRKEKRFETKNLSVTPDSMKYLIPLVFILLNLNWYLRRRSGIL